MRWSTRPSRAQGDRNAAATRALLEARRTRTLAPRLRLRRRGARRLSPARTRSGRNTADPYEETQIDPANLAAVSLFASMSEADLRRIATFASEDSAPEGATLMREGDYSPDMVAIESGTATVVRDGATIGTLGPGDVFGEMGVLEHALRTATVVASSPMRLIRLTSWDVKRLPKDVRERMAELVAERRTPGGSDPAASG